MREPANIRIDVPIKEIPKGPPFMTLAEYLVETFLELSKLTEPPLECLAVILDSLRYIFEANIA